MVSFGNVDSRGWLDADGKPCLRDAATFRLWAVHNNAHDLVAYVALPVDQFLGDVSGVAMAIVERLEAGEVTTAD